MGLSHIGETPQTEITKQEYATGDRDPRLGEVRFDERWITLVMLAKLKNSGTRNGYRIDINGFMDWWAHKRDPRLSTADCPLHATRTDLELFTAWLALREPPLAASTQRRKIAVISSFYALAERHELIVRTPLIGVSRRRSTTRMFTSGSPAMRRMRC